MKIKSKMLIYILATSAIIYIIAIGLITIKSRSLALNQVTNVTNTQARESANLIKSKIEVYLNITKTLAKTVEDYDLIPFHYLDTLYLEAQKNVIEEYPEFYSVATSFELSAIDTSWEEDHGRRLTGWFRDENGVIQYFEKELNLEGDDIGSAYHEMKTSGIPMVVDPEMYSYTGDPEDEYLNSNFSFPIMHNDRFIGLAGIDVDLQKFQEIINEIEPFENSYAYLLSNNGTFAAHPNDELLGEKIEKVSPQLTDQNEILNNIKNGNSFSFNYKDEESGTKYYYSFAPVEISGVNTPWSIATIVPYNAIQNRANQIFYIALAVGVIGLVLLSAVVWIIANNISNPIEKITFILKNIAKGKIDNSLKTDVKTSDEISEMATALNTSIDELNKKAEFATHIGKGNFEHEFELPGEDDHLGQSLIDMRNSLAKAKKEEENRKIEDEKRRWINEGLTKFSDILRLNHDDIEKLTYDIIKNLVEYLGAVQGGLFLLNDEDRENIFYELKAAYAYDRQKFLEKHIKPGEGLIGACVLEKKSKYMTELPQDYMEITSGLGDANPDALLIVPLKTEEEVLGVVELASFNKFEEYQRTFVEKVAESIASTLASVRVNIRTSQLLEKSQQQAEEMAAQEEEMRQNMEELKATQEESARRESQLTGIIDAIDSLLIKTEIDKEKNILSINQLFSDTFEYQESEIKGSSIEQVIPEEDLESFREDWNKILNGETLQKTVQRKTKSGKKISLITSFSPIKDKDGNIDKILMFAFKQ
ncbi:MAG: GAF domain-containing protein [Bacteroidales bacterium]